MKHLAIITKTLIAVTETTVTTKTLTITATETKIFGQRIKIKDANRNECFKSIQSI